MFKFRDQLYLFYELEVHDLSELWYIYVIQVRGQTSQQPPTVFDNQVINDNYVILYDNNTVLRRQFALSEVSPEDDTIVQPPSSNSSNKLKILIYMFAQFNLNDPFLNDGVASLQHLLFMSNAYDRVYKVRTSPVITVPPVSQIPPLLSVGSPFPLQYENSTEPVLCYVAGGPAINSRHRTAVIPIPGPLYLTQKYAIDWVLLNNSADGQAYRNNGSQNSDWYGYGVPILAVYDGQVVSLRDGQIENEPGQPPAVIITRETLPGNHLVIKVHNEELYFFYAHLQPGSLLVSVGQNVTRGQPLARMGNSGNSGCPHLHVHLNNGPDPLQSEGQPHHYSTFDYVGDAELAAVLGGGDSFFPLVFTPTSEPTPDHRTDELPTEKALLYFT
jgi:murein DD-endopeptidase MepM/ murein hydrolase activator NlpD